MLSSITIRNFRGIKEGTIQDLSNINIFVGRNNTGKSSVLEAIQLLSTTVVIYDPLQRQIMDQLMSRRVNRSAGYKSLCYNYKQDKGLEFELSADKSVVSFVMDTPNTWKISSHLLQDFYMQGHATGATLAQAGRSTGGTFTDFITLLKSFATSFPKAEKIMVPMLESVRNCIIIDSLLVHQFPAVERIVLQDLFNTRKDKIMIKILNEAYGTDIESISYLPDERGVYSLLLMFPSKSVRVDEMGDGFRFALVIISLMLAFDMKISLIEEMENHQHPRALRHIAQILVNNSIENNTQLFLTTHNIELIKAFIEAVEGKLDQLRVFHFDLKEGILEARPVRGMDAKMLDDLGMDLRLLHEYG